MKLNRKTKDRGFTLVEILLVVGFISLASIGIYTVYSKVQTSNAALTEGKNLDTIRAGVKNLYGGQMNYAGISNSVLNDARVTPDSMRAIPYVAGATSITNSFGGAVQVSSVGLNSGTNNGFRITYSQVPGSVCSKLVSGAGTNWDQITVGATYVKSFGTGNLNITALASVCASDTGGGVSINFESL